MHAAEAALLKKPILVDNGGRRINGERRLYTYNGYLPERRSGGERRSGKDRRVKPRLG